MSPVKGSRQVCSQPLTTKVDAAIFDGFGLAWLCGRDRVWAIYRAVACGWYLAASRLVVLLCLVLWIGLAKESLSFLLKHSAGKCVQLKLPRCVASSKAGNALGWTFALVHRSRIIDRIPVDLNISVSFITRQFFEAEVFCRRPAIIDH